MIPFKLSELTAADRQGALRLYGQDREIFEVTSDSRKVTDRGCLFVALSGERFDGHAFVAEVIKKGACAVGVSESFYALHQAELAGSGISVVTAPDTLRLWGLCGLACRQHFAGTVVSITGSCGKTTVKEMTAAILRRSGKVLATQANFNNDVGVPLTLLSLQGDERYAVIEQGASHPQDIARTCEFVQAQYCVITNAGHAHIEGFGSAYGVYRGKSEMLDDVLRRGGSAAVPSDSPWAESWQQDYAPYVQAGRLHFFGKAEQNLVSIRDLQSSEDSLTFTLQLRDPARLSCITAIEVNLALLGAHNAQNAAAAAALTLLAGARPEDIKAGLESCAPVAGRLKVLRAPGLVVLDDAYNASFDSVLAGLERLHSFKEYSRIAVLADMGELGTDSVKLHQAAGKAACSAELTALLCFGPKSTDTAECGPQGCSRHFADKGALCAELTALLDRLRSEHRQAAVLVKGSHSMHMEEVVAALRGHFSLQEQA